LLHNSLSKEQPQRAKARKAKEAVEHSGDRCNNQSYAASWDEQHFKIGSFWSSREETVTRGKHSEQNKCPKQRKNVSVCCWYP